jgi:hypothetical protein
LSAAQERKEECRREVRGWLANRPALQFRAGAIHKGVTREGRENGTTANFETQEITDALVFLAGVKHVEIHDDPDGATPHFQASSAGVLAHERRK